MVYDAHCSKQNMMKATLQQKAVSYVTCYGSSSCCCKMFLRLWMFELNYEVEMRFSLFAFEKTRQLN